jgi:maltose O-acetyltransferase
MPQPSHLTPLHVTPQRTELDYMLAGELYNAADPDLVSRRARAHRLCEAFNRTPEDNAETRQAILDKLLPHRGEGADVAGPINFDYGEFTTFGRGVYANFNLIVLDVCPVTVSDNVMLGPNVSLVTPIHPMRWQERNVRTAADGSGFDYEYAAPITIEANCWLATNVTVTGGVTIGEGSVIGAGSVVTHDIPANSFAAGIPCKVIREISEADRMTLPTRVPESNS